MGGSVWWWASKCLVAVAINPTPLYVIKPVGVAGCYLMKYLLVVLMLFVAVLVRADGFTGKSRAFIYENTTSRGGMVVSNTESRLVTRTADYTYAIFFFKDGLCYMWAVDIDADYRRDILANLMETGFKREADTRLTAPNDNSATPSSHYAERYSNGELIYCFVSASVNGGSGKCMIIMLME